jgi:hypothetical protein
MMNVYVNNALFEKDLERDKFTRYSIAKSGVYEFRVVPNNMFRGMSVREFIDVSQGHIYTFAVTGKGTNLDIAPIPDEPKETAEGMAGVRFVNVATGNVECNIHIDDAPVADGLTHLDTTDYITIAPGVYNVKVYSSADNSMMYEIPAVTFEEGKFYGGYLCGEEGKTTLAMSIEGITFIK